MIAGFTHHGGGIAAAMARWGGTRADWLDLSTGINPRPWAGRVAFDWRALPDAGALAALERAAAEHFGASPTHCCALPGSELGLRLIGRILDGPATYLWPAYRTHGAAFADGVAGHDGPGTRPTLLLANPNNPDGRIVPPETLRQWHDTLAARGGWLVVDEAFADATPHVSVAGHVGHWPGLVVLRSFGKFFGLAGLRLGFVLGPDAVMARLRALLGDWPLGAAALAHGTAAYRDCVWVARTRGDLARRAERMDAMLAAHGLRATGQCPHFRLIRDARAPEVFATLARHRILSRPFEHDASWLRLGIPAREADWARLDWALRDG